MNHAIRISHFIDPDSFELRRDVTLSIQGGRVAEVRSGGAASQVLDLGDALCMPGFVNAHAHLDLSHLHLQVPGGLKFHEWGPVIMAARSLPAPLIQAGIADAVGMLAASGTTAVLDISVAADSLAALARHGIRSVLALEALGFDPARAEPAMNAVDALIRDRFELERDRLGSDAGEGEEPAAVAGIDHGFSPHATFSTSADLYRLAMGRAFGEGRVLTTHAAETREEQQFLRTGDGPYRDFMARFGVDLGGFHGYGAGSIALLADWLGPWLRPENPQLVLVHCNYPEASDYEWLAQARPSVCWCPRSHAWFGHEPWPWAEMRATGANLVLGTDSLASNDGLDMLGEIRQARRTVPDADVIELFRAATTNGRRALSIAENAADLAVWELPGGAADTRAALESLLERTPRLLAAFSRGNLIARAI